MHRHVKIFAAAVLAVTVVFVVARYQMIYWQAEVSGEEARRPSVRLDTTIGKYPSSEANGA